MEYGRFADRRYANNVARFADTYNCVKLVFHNTDILVDILATILVRMLTSRDFPFQLATRITSGNCKFEQSSNGPP